MSVTRPRGPLPARVYWFRRLLVVAVAFGLVFGLSRLFAGTGDDPESPVAQRASAVSGSATPSAVSTADARPSPAATPGRKKKTREPLAVPTGPCSDDDVRIVPSVDGDAYAGEDVTLTLRLTTFASPACTWEVSAENVAVRLSSGDDRIWTSQECPAAVPTTPVVLRQAKATEVQVVWSGRRSDADCSRTTLWAQPGWYHVAAAAMGSEPETQQFELRAPAPITITPTPTPSKGAKAPKKPRG